MIREYVPQDFEACVKIINEVWDFDGKFKPARLSTLFKIFYTSSSLTASNFTFVVEENGVVKGFLFGESGRHNHALAELTEVFGYWIFALKLLLLWGVKLKKKIHYLTIFLEHEKNRNHIKPRKDEVNLFAVSPSAQGKGYGRALMNRFVDFCEARHTHRITLETNEECNYGFYRHFGFNKIGEFNSPLLKEYSSKSGLTYVYELEIPSSAKSLL